jgi:hypothetical protein
MKISQTFLTGSFVLLAVSAILLSGSSAFAQYKAPSQYFRKDSPGVNRGGTAPNQPGAPGSPATPAAPARPSAPDRPKFKDVSVNSQFFFVNDTNRAFAWTKATATTAKNAQGVTRAINVETPVQR